MKALFSAITLLLLCSSLNAESPSEEMGPEARTAYLRYTDALQQLEMQYAAALREAMTSAIKQGQLDRAKLIESEVNRIEAEIALRKRPKDLKTIILAHKWYRNYRDGRRENIEFHENMEVVFNGEANGTWKIEGDALVWTDRQKSSRKFHFNDLKNPVGVHKTKSVLQRLIPR
ncbi:MAG: hypothetical protein AAGC68_03105 [Verrucomicrobiota bacterium]